MSDAHSTGDPFALPMGSMENAVAPKKRGRKKTPGVIHYLEDIAGLWVFIEVGGDREIIAHETLIERKEKLKRMIDNGF